MVNDFWKEINEEAEKIREANIQTPIERARKEIDEYEGINAKRFDFTKDKIDKKKLYNCCPVCKRGFILTKNDFDDIKKFSDVKVIGVNGNILEYVCYSCGKK